MQSPIFILILIFSFSATYIITFIALKYAVKSGLIDHPGSRTSHKVSTPRGGGVSIVIVFLVSLILLWFFELVETKLIFPEILIGGGIIAIVGFWDDHQHVPAKWRFIIHFVATFITLSFIPELSSISFFSLNIELSSFAIIFYSIALVWLLNLYNFMDGIDGLASIEAITVLLGAIIILYSQGNLDESKLFLILISCITGFLIWNWTPAKIFMGDACSGFLGFTLGYIALSTSSNDSLNINLWSWLILLAVFIVDATYTLIQRIYNGDEWYKAHRCHAYQILARKYNSHKKVTITVIVINSVWLFPLAFLASVYEYMAPILALTAISPLLYIAYKVKAGFINVNDSKQV